MASITTQRNGRRIIQFVGKDGKRRSLRLGKVSMRQAESVKVKVEDLVAGSITNHAISGDTAHWLQRVDDVLYGKLASVGLVPKRESAKLASFLDSYIAERTDVKASTQITYQNVRRNLVEFFGADIALRDVAPGQAERFRLFLAKSLADNTVRRRCGIARQFFTVAKRRRLIDENPFDDMPVAVRSNRERVFFVTRGMATKVLEACPDAEWRVIFALCRFAGLRCTSEVLGLRWEDIDWAQSRMTIRSPKTEHHEGKALRVCPIFPELLPYVREAFELAEPGSVFVVSRYRDTNANLRTQMRRIIRRAGLEPWPKLFQNLRSSCQTELEDRFPSHVVCAWLGNSVPVAQKHYLQVTESHFEEATKAVQNPVQRRAAVGCTSVQDAEADNSQVVGLPQFADAGDVVAAWCNMPESEKWAIQDLNL